MDYRERAVDTTIASPLSSVSISWNSTWCDQVEEKISIYVLETIYYIHYSHIQNRYRYLTNDIGSSYPISLVREPLLVSVIATISIIRHLTSRNRYRTSDHYNGSTSKPMIDLACPRYTRDIHLSDHASSCVRGLYVDLVNSIGISYVATDEENYLEGCCVRHETHNI